MTQTPEPGGEKKVDPAMLPVEDVPGLPRVLLVGDSISIGYTLPVRELLRGKANVHRPLFNCGPTHRGVEMLPQIVGAGAWDVIHFNFGLHDLKIMDDGKHQVPPGAYAENLRVLGRAFLAAGRRVIWCTTTPVPEGKLSPPRHPADVLAFNRAAQEVMIALKIPTHDLCSFAASKLAQIQLRENVHFTPEGSRDLAGSVVGAIQAAWAE
ncbi:MAG: SGNH/GDSL hydrolase family protein [Planctomycetota bacterium]|nr:SGNH/GDSL hydrolase family protein [Planctomycetota bacterium]